MHILSLICSLIIQVGKFQSVILRKFRPVLTITETGDIDSTFDLEMDTERRHGEFTAR
jgi:hypothetical protein